MNKEEWKAKNPSIQPIRMAGKIDFSLFTLHFSLTFRLLLSSPLIDEKEDGGKDDEDGDHECPYVSDT